MKKLHWRRSCFRAAAACVASALLVTSGCSGKQNASEVKEPEGKRALIKFVTSEYSTTTKPILDGIVSRFESEHPDIDVELQVVNWDILDGVYTNMLAQNEPPDLLNTNFYSHFAKRGLLNDMADILPESFRSNLYPFLLEKDRYNGVQYAIPYVASVRSLYYNKALFSQAGIAGPPLTWEQLADDARKIRQFTPARGFGIDMTDNEIHANLSYFFIGAGGGWLKDGKWAINQPANVEGLEFLKKIYDEGLTDEEPTVTTRDEKQRILGDDGLAMMISGNYFSSVVPKEFPGFKWGSGPIPVKEGQPPMTFGVHDVLISFKTAHTDKQALSQFIQFLYSDEQYVSMVEQEGFVPVTRSAGDAMSAADAAMGADLHALASAQFIPIEKPAWARVMDTARKLGSAVLSGRYTPKAALDELQRVALEADQETG
ncbi:ABC transporter substrate-binding protein [Paenibacillus sp. D51F]